MLELSNEQVVALAEMNARRFVNGVWIDLVQTDKVLSVDPTLENRPWKAFQAARQLNNIQADENLLAVLRIEAYASSFYAKPAIRTWLAR